MFWASRGLDMGSSYHIKCVWQAHGGWIIAVPPCSATVRRGATAAYERCITNPREGLWTTPVVRYTA